MEDNINKLDQFSLLFEKHGRVILSDNFSGEFKKKFDGQFDFYNKLEPAIFTGIVENVSFNALATKNNMGEFIAFYHGSFTQLSLFAYLVFSDQRVFPEMGDISKEKSDSQIIELLKNGQISQALQMNFLPFDLLRRNAAERIAECACLILFSHEVGHIRGCHLDLLMEEYQISTHAEFNVIPLSEQKSLLLRTLELEADTVALINSLRIWRLLAKKTGVHNVDGLRPTQVWLLAVDLLFSVMSLTHSKLREGELSSHPSMITRYYNTRIGKIMQQDDEELKNELKQPNYLLPWFINQGFSTSLLNHFNKRAEFKPDISEWLELQRNIEALYPRLEFYQEAREKRLKHNE